MFWNLMSLWRISVGEELKENIMCIKVHEKLVEEKMGVVNCVWCVKEKKSRKGTHEKKLKEKKSEKKEKYKAKNMYVVGKIEA